MADVHSAIKSEHEFVAVNIKDEPHSDSEDCPGSSPAPCGTQTTDCNSFTVRKREIEDDTESRSPAGDTDEFIKKEEPEMSDSSEHSHEEDPLTVTTCKSEDDTIKGEEVYKTEDCEVSPGPNLSSVTSVAIKTSRKGTDERPVKEGRVKSNCQLDSADVRYCDTANNVSDLKQGHQHSFVCNTCNKSFKCWRYLKQHEGIVHATDDCSFVCNICSKSFSNKRYLKVHQVVHSGRRPYVCSICSKAFRQKGDLNKHRSIHTDQHRFMCNICNKAFARKSNFIRHQVVHTGERSFTCNLCSKRFKYKANLDYHQIVHTGERSFFCDACDKTFARKGNLIRHKASHTREHFSCLQHVEQELQA